MMSSIIMNGTFGSRLYGTSVETSDYDFKSVIIPDARTIIDQRVKHVQTVDVDSGGFKHEYEFIPLSLFLHGLTSAETNALDMLFIPRHLFLTEPRPLWDVIVSLRSSLIPRRLDAMVSYSKSHVSKYVVKASRLHALEHIINTLSKFEQTARLSSYSDAINRSFFDISSEVLDHIRHVDIEQSNGSMLRHLEVCAVKAQYTLTVQGARALFEKKLAEYGKRSRRAAEDSIDWKGLMHAVRIAQQAIELLETEMITFPRPNAQELIRIRNGDCSFDETCAKLEELYGKILELRETATTLTNSPDMKVVKNMVYREYSEAIKIAFS